MIKVLILCSLLAFTFTTTPTNYNWEGIWNVTQDEPNYPCDVPRAGTTVNITANGDHLIMYGYADFSSCDSDWELDWNSTTISVPEHYDASDDSYVNAKLSLEDGNVVAHISFYIEEAYGCSATLSRPAL